MLQHYYFLLTFIMYNLVSRCHLNVSQVVVLETVISPPLQKREVK